MMPNIGVSASTSSSAAANAGQGDFNVTGGAGSSGVGGGQYGWLVWVGLGILALAGLTLFLRRKKH